MCINIYFFFPKHNFYVEKNTKDRRFIFNKFYLFTKIFNNSNELFNIIYIILFSVNFIVKILETACKCLSLIQFLYEFFGNLTLKMFIRKCTMKTN